MEWPDLEEFWQGLILSRPSRVYHPPTNLYETENEFVVMMAVSMADKESLKVLYQGGTLCIQGIRKEPEKDVPKRYHLMEINYGSFERRIIINADIEPESITSSYSDGMLVVRIPKAKPKSIEVEEN